MKNNFLKKIVLFFTIFGALLVSINGYAILNEASQITREESSVIESKPQIDINYLGQTPMNPTINQEITLKYEIVPHPFRLPVNKDVDLIFLVDTSKGMDSKNYLKDLKTSLVKFVNSFVKTEDNQPMFNNLSISLISFSSRGNIKEQLIPIINNGQVKENQLTSLISSIENLQVSKENGLSEKNLGEGLRQTGYLLSQGNPNREKVLIQVSEGQLTQSTVISSSETKQFYLEIDNKVPGINEGDRPYLFTNPNGNSDGQKNQADDYAIEVAKLIENKVNHVFSIMVGGSSENSAHHRGLKGAHGALGGKDSNFFYTSTTNYDEIFSSIANELQKLYTINLQPHITLTSNVSSINNSQLEIPSIDYQLDENGWYTAPSQIIEFTIKATEPGLFNIFNNNQFSYQDIYGQKINIEFENPLVTVTSESSDMSVDIYFEPYQALIGDTVATNIMINSSNSDTISGVNVSINNYEELNKYFSGNLPSQFELNENSQQYELTVKDYANISSSSDTPYTLTGSYRVGAQAEPTYLTSMINLKRGQLKVKVVDENGTDITHLTTVTLDKVEKESSFEDGYLLFDTLPTGDYNLQLNSLPAGLSIGESESKGKVRIDYKNNIAYYTFTVAGVYTEEAIPRIDATLSSVIPSSGPNGQEVDVTYTINPQNFSASFNSNSNDKDIAVLIDTSSANNLWGNIHTALLNDILNEFYNNRNGAYLNMSFIPYNEDISYYATDHTSNDPRNKLQNDLTNIKPTNNSKRNLNLALEKAKEFFNNSTNKQASKNIVIIAFGDPSDSLIDASKYTQYNVITLAINQSNNEQTTEYSTLKEWHSNLGGLASSYLIAKNDGNNITNNVMKEVAKLIKGNSGNNVISVKPILNFDLGNDFAAISELSQKEGTQYKLEVPTVTYNPMTKNEDGTYIYEANSFDVSFKVKVQTNQVGTITFGNIEDKTYNNITYEQLNGTMVTKLIETPQFNIKDDDKVIYSNNSIDILEIQPADSFTLTGSSNSSRIKTGTESCAITVDDVEYEVNITHMSMPEFIGKAEKIDGKYDVVVLGRYVDSSLTASNDELNQYKYRDYYYNRGSNNEENDITMRKANELIEFMNKNQLVYIDSDIVNNSSNSNFDYNQTNIYKMFSNSQNISQKNVKTNFVTSKQSGDSIVTVQKVINDYISLNTKEKGFNLSIIDPIPNDITTDNMNAIDGKAENRNRYLDVTVKNADNSKENVNLNLYLDLNGNGLYTEDEIVVSRTQLSLPLENYQLDFSVHPDFIGLLEWKLEVVREDVNQTKTYLTGNNFFHRLTEEKKEIKVLQITAQENYQEVNGQGNTETDTNYQVLNLNSNDKFKELLSSLELKDYSIQIDIIHYKEYLNYLNRSDDELEDHELKFKYLNGYYDMVITGFQDVYGRNAFGGENNQIVESLIDFIKTGQGLMLTHDTIEKSDTPSMFNTFRVFSGQSRFPTFLNGEEVNDFNGGATRCYMKSIATSM